MTTRLRTLAAAWPLLGLVLLRVWVPSDGGVTLCPFALCTGMACPGCGMTRAMAWLARGDLERAISYHPLAPLIALEIGAGWALWMARRRGRAGWVNRHWIDVVLLATGFALLGLWVLRWVLGTLPPV